MGNCIDRGLAAGRERTQNTGNGLIGDCINRGFNAGKERTQNLDSKQQEFIDRGFDAGRERTQGKEYSVQSGDNLWNIADQRIKQEKGLIGQVFGSKTTDGDIDKKIQELTKINQIQDPDLIYPDQKLKFSA